MQTVVAEAIGSLERFGPTWWQSPESAVLADLELKRGIDRFAGKAGIAVFGCLAFGLHPFRFSSGLRASRPTASGSAID
jgi:hypothetical protein